MQAWGTSPKKASSRRGHETIHRSVRMAASRDSHTRRSNPGHTHHTMSQAAQISGPPRVTTQCVREVGLGLGRRYGCDT